MAGVVFTERECRRVERGDRADRMSVDVVEPDGQVARRWPDLVHRRASGDLELDAPSPARCAEQEQGFDCHNAQCDALKVLDPNPRIVEGLSALIDNRLPVRQGGPPRHAVCLCCWRDFLTAARVGRLAGLIIGFAAMYRKYRDL